MKKRLQELLTSMAEYEEQFSAPFAVDEATGMFLYDFVRSHKPKRILELGTWRGASAIYMAAALLENGGGELVTVDRGNDRVEQARENFRLSGLTNMITQVVADIDDYLPQDASIYDLVFLDALKKDQAKWLKQLLFQNLRPGSFIVVDDVITMKDRMENLYEFVENHPHLSSSIERVDDGLMVIKVVN